MKVQTQSVHFSADHKLLSFIESKIGKLDNFFDKIIYANVVLKLENSGQVREKIAEVSLKIPGSILYVKESSRTFETAVDTAIRSLKRQLVRYKQRRRAV